MKPGAAVVFCILFGGVLISGTLAYRGCATSIERRAREADERREQKIAVERHNAETEQLRVDNLSRKVVGDNEIRQAAALYDLGQCRAAYEKFKVGVDKGGIGTESENIKAMASFLGRGDCARVITLGARARSGVAVTPRDTGLRLNLKGLFKGGVSGFRHYYPIFEVLAYRGQGDQREAAALAERELAKYEDMNMWPVPLLMFYAGDLSAEEFSDLLKGNSGPAAESNAFGAVELQLRQGNSSEVVAKLKSAARDLKGLRDWEAANPILHSLCSDLIDRANKQGSE